MLWVITGIVVVAILGFLLWLGLNSDRNHP